MFKCIERVCLSVQKRVCVFKYVESVERVKDIEKMDFMSLKKDREFFLIYFVCLVYIHVLQVCKKFLHLFIFIFNFFFYFNIWQSCFSLNHRLFLPCSMYIFQLKIVSIWLKTVQISKRDRVHPNLDPEKNIQIQDL